MISLKAQCAAILSLLSSSLFAQIHLIKDLSPGYDSSFAGIPKYLTAFETGIVFSCDYEGSGRELWKSDGVLQTLVKDINSSGDSHPSNPTRYIEEIPMFGKPLIAINGKVLFAANDGVHGFEMWISDGTTSGTKQIKDIFPGTIGSYPRWMVSLGNFVYFSADDGIHGQELWRTDGTEAGTELVIDINNGVASSDPTEITVLFPSLLFNANDGAHGSELWKSDGTAVNTTLLKDLNPGTGDGMGLDIMGSADNFYFKSDAAIWKSDGTQAGTKLILNTSANLGCVFNNRLYFSNQNGELSSTDGVTTEVEVNSPEGPDRQFTFGNETIKVVDGELYYGFGYVDDHSIDNSGNSTLIDSHIEVLKLSSETGGFEIFYSYNNGGMIFNLDDYGAGVTDILKWNNEFYVSFYHQQGNWLKMKGRLEVVAYNSQEIVVHGGLYTSNEFYYDGVYYRLTKWDGTSSRKLYNHYVARSSWIQSVEIFNDKVFFGQIGQSAADKVGYVTDGLSATVATEDSVLWSTVLGDEIYYVKNGKDLEDFELWKSDGTPTGSEYIRTFHWVEDLSASATAVFIVTMDALNKRELWSINNTQSQPVFLKNVEYVAGRLRPINNLVWFLVGTDLSLWRSDGTPDGTYNVKGLNVNGYTYPEFVVEYNNFYYTVASNESGEFDLWKSDGTDAGTSVALSKTELDLKLVTRIHSSELVIYLMGTTDSDEQRLISYSGDDAEVLYELPVTEFIAANDLALFTHDNELWTTSGTFTSTKKIADNAVDIPLSKRLLRISADKGYFVGYDAEHGHELWETDGTAEGTKLFLDIQPGVKSSRPVQVIFNNGFMYFEATTVADGREFYSYYVGLPTDAEEDAGLEALYPNPSTGSMMIKSRSNILDIETFDLSGKSVCADLEIHDGNETRLKIHNPGLYIIRIRTNDGIIQKKVSVIK